MKLDSELRTLLYLKKSLDEDVPSKKTLIILKLIMASLVMVCVLTFMATSSGFLSPLFAIPLAAVCGLFCGHISYYLRSAEIWPYYSRHINRASVEKRLNEIQP